MNPTTPIFSVKEINESAAQILDTTFGVVRVRGEISGLKIATSGHAYFSLKDETCAINGVIFRNPKARELKEGDKIVATGRVTIYPQTGKFQIIITSFEADGAGDLYRKFLELKAKLESQGLFDSSRKKKIPDFVQTVAVITSESGAVFHDIRKVLSKLAPNIRIRLIPTLVQGPGALEQILNAVSVVEEHRLGDVLIIARGGGSLEDLAVFNEERLARAVFALTIPTISAIGHETDFTILDFVADLRAPTPSAAAEHIGSPFYALRTQVLKDAQQLSSAMGRKILMIAEKIKNMRGRLLPPQLRIQFLIQRADEIQLRLISGLWGNLSQKIERITRAEALLRALSPLQVLDRGFAIVHKSGSSKPISSVAHLQGEISIRVKDGISTGKYERF